MKIGHCKDCIHWKHTGHTTGNCDKIYAYVGEVGNTDCRRWSLNNFGCVLFKPKPKGPFTVYLGLNNAWHIKYLGLRFVVRTANEMEAREGARRLNDEWLRRE